MRRLAPVLALMLAAAAGCTAAAGERLRDDDFPPEGALEAVSSESATASSSHRSRLGLDLAGTVRPDGDLDLVATIRVSGRLVAPPVVRIGLPAGATLVSGFAEEVLAAPGRDVVHTRTFTIHPALGPVRVSVQSIGVGYGTVVKAQWPAAEPAPEPAP